jgi:hypothetical protein
MGEKRHEMFQSITYLIYKLARINILGVLLIFLVGCQEVAPPGSVSPPRNIFLTIIGALLFLTVFFYAGFKAFLDGPTSARTFNKAEQRTRAAGFLIGALSALLLVAIDSAGPISALDILAFFPWYFLIIVGIIFGFGLALVSKLVASLQPNSGTGFLLMVITFISGAGLYLILFTGGLQDKVLAATLPVFIGLLLFRMLFPTKQSLPVNRETKRPKFIKSYQEKN